MKTMTVTQAARNFSDLINRVQYQGISVELVKSKKTVAVISPVSPKPVMTVADLADFFASVPSLADDAEQFAKDIEDVDKQTPKVVDEWER